MARPVSSLAMEQNQLRYWLAVLFHEQKEYDSKDVMKKVPAFLITCLLGGLEACRDQNITSRDELAPVVNALQKGVQPLSDEHDLDTLMAQIGEARYVLLGEASHGTADFYAWRAAITRRLIEEKGFTFVAVEGDWPDAYELNQYINGWGAPGRARQVLQAFNRWPTWMWANEEIADLTEWMRAYNDRQSAERKASFYGLDVYSLWESLERLKVDIGTTDAELTRLLQEITQCLGPYQDDEQAYAVATLRGTRCSDALNRLLERIRSQYPAAATQLDQFNIEQNALVAVNAERYYYAMARDDADSWNVRDRHMAETLDRLKGLHGPDAKAIVWAHNTHVGDARYTDMAQAGMVNLGQLVRENHPGLETYIVGFGTYGGEVIAGKRWDAPAERMRVPQAPKNSWDEVLHTIAPENKLVLLNQLRSAPELASARGQRAIGVVYNPAREAGNYVPTALVERYDGFIFIDKTRALHPLDITVGGRKEHSEAPVGAYALIND